MLKGTHVAKRRTPSQSEAKGLLFSLYSIDHYEWSARDVRAGLANAQHVWHSPEISMELRWVLDQAVPSFLVVKLAAVVEACAVILWSRRFSEIKERKFSLEAQESVRSSDRHDGVMGRVPSLHRPCAVAAA